MKSAGSEAGLKTHAKPLVYCVFGPTACRKSEFALEIAEKLNAEIINCDSVQVYTKVQIGANKPSPQELKKIPHHLIDFVEPQETYTAGQFHRDFHEVIRKRSEEGVKVFVLVGGSGFYARAALVGLYPVDASSPEKRKKLTEEWYSNNGRELYKELLARDPEYAKKIGPTDPRRVIRAIEILRDSEFKTMAALEENLKSQPRIFEAKQVALFREREDLKAKILDRSKLMLKSGLVEEVQSLLNEGLKDWAPLRSVGYAEVVAFLEGKLETELADEISKNTARLAKRQMTWLRSEPDVTWFHAENDWQRALLHAQKEAASFTV